MTLQVRLTAQYEPVEGAQQVAVSRAVPIMGGLGRRIVTNARRRVPVRTGALRDSIGSSVSSNTSSVRLDVFASAPHARYVEDGTDPHVIRPRRARALAFQAGGRTVFAMRVNHPGTKATNFLSGAVADELAADGLA
ncbi:HK97 gp10 family phage protein [Nocardia asiatica]|uniref:HK97 gp10 family phage protein n=1 Tax=Nocardia asiatica TaxID=209252 RepID=UPI002454DDD1|nr:HK97 gp10 family phage protein [Nocardia asiatica]